MEHTGRYQNFVLSLGLLLFFSTGFYLQAHEPEKTDSTQQTLTLAQIENNGVKRFSNSEVPQLKFMVNTNMKECKMHISTNYPNQFKVRFIDYWGNSVKVYHDLYSDSPIDVSEFKNQIVVLNIMENKGNKLLSSQVVNLKQRNFW